MKRCPCCRETKPVSDFQKHAGTKDGLQTYCRPCWKIKVYEWREKNPEKFAASVAKRNRRKADNNRWRLEHRETQKAHRAVSWAVGTGRLVRPERCSECDETGRIEAHHADYSKPLDVEWLCGRCHRARHPKIMVMA